jgi:hypothetical protein
VLNVEKPGFWDLATFSKSRGSESDYFYISNMIAGAAKILFQNNLPAVIKYVFDNFKYPKLTY